jgi:hypothetical protein
MFWDGTRWVDERPTPTPAVFSGPRRLRDWIATVPILLLAPALLFPFLPAMATTVGPSLTVAGPVTPGATLPVKASGFTSGTMFQLQWDGSSTGMPMLRTTTGAALVLNVHVPSQTKLGTHVVTAVLPAWAQYAVRFGSAPATPNRGRTILAATNVMVVAKISGAVATPPPSPAPPAGAAAPTGAPTRAPTAAPTAAPTPVPTAAPTVAPTARPTAAPTAAPTVAPPAGSGAWAVPFLGRTPSGQVTVNGQTNVTISGKQFVNLPTGEDAIVVSNSSNVTITANDFSGNTGDIYVVDSTNVTVTWNRYRNVGDGSIGSGHSNFVQFNRTTGGYIGHNKGLGGDTEDIISLFQSQGASAADPLVIEANAFEGTTWSSGSGSGSMLGDGGGSHIVIRDNTFLSPGQVGIGVSGGTDIHVLDNVIYGAQRSSSNVGLYVWNQTSGTCSGVEVAGNTVRWYNASGAENPYWDSATCGAVAGVSTNDWHAALDPTSLQVAL